MLSRNSKKAQAFYSKHCTFYRKCSHRKRNGSCAFLRAHRYGSQQKVLHFLQKAQRILRFPQRCTGYMVHTLIAHARKHVSRLAKQSTMNQKQAFEVFCKERYRGFDEEDNEEEEAIPSCKRSKTVMRRGEDPGCAQEQECGGQWHSLSKVPALGETSRISDRFTRFTWHLQCFMFACQKTCEFLNTHSILFIHTATHPRV